MKKAEVSGTIMMYVLSGLVITLAIGFGVSQLFSVSDSVSSMQCLKFQQSFKEHLIKSRPIGTFDPDGISVGCDIASVCFINVDEDPDTMDNKIVKDSWTSAIEKNVFLIDAFGFPVSSFYVRGLAPTSGDNNNNNYLCLPVEYGMLPITLKGKGKTIEIKKQGN